MTQNESASFVGYTCAYTPLPLFDAMGLAPWRIRPDGPWPEEAASLLHENLCPHVKRVLDRRLAGDLPSLAAVVIMHGCEAMRRLVDAWGVAAPEDEVFLADLPLAAGEASVSFFAQELQGMAAFLAAATGRDVPDDEALERSVAGYAELGDCFDDLAQAVARGRLKGGAKRLQILRNDAVCRPLSEANDAAQAAVSEIEDEGGAPRGVPLFMHGNVLPTPEALELLESCGVRLVGDDLCTGSRQVAGWQLEGSGDRWHRLARGIMSRPRCARTLNPQAPASLSQEVKDAAKKAEAKGVLVHVVKFCDSYLARIPKLRRDLEKAELPLLVLDGDCTMRSLGQQRTRIEAFVEMLAE